jgi:diketogulonate reductase-like aldo/keto reductase
MQAVVPRSSKQERIAANRVLGFELSDSHMRRIDALDSIVDLEAV